MKITPLKNVLQSIFGFIFLMTAASPASHAGLVAQFAGEVVDIVDPFGAFSGVAIGDSVSGEFRYSGSIPASYNDGSFAQYSYAVSPGGSNQMTATVGAYRLEARQEMFVQVYSPSYFVTGVDFQFLDADSSLLSTIGLPVGYTLTSPGAYVGLYTESYRASSTFPLPPSSLLDLAQYDDPSTSGFFFVDIRDSNGDYVDSAFASFRITSLQSVPEPNSLTICLVGLGTLTMMRRRRLTSQSAKEF